MKRRKRLLILLTCIAFLLSGTLSLAENGNPAGYSAKNNALRASADKIPVKSIMSQSAVVADQIVPGKLVVEFKDGTVSVRSKSLQSMASGTVKSLEYAGSGDVALVNLSENANIEEAIEQISKQPNVEFVEPLYILRAYSADTGEKQLLTGTVYETVTQSVYGPDDPYYLKKWQWGLQAINVTDIWERVPVDKRSSVTIAVIDTGVDVDHEDLKDSIVAGYDFVNQDDNPDDDNGHGTHVAGIAAAITNNGKGIAGVAGGAKIMPVKVLNAKGVGTSLDIYLGIMYAVNNGADVINLSLGSQIPGLLVKEAVDYALANDVVVVAASGNDYSEMVGYPAAFDGVIAVGAVDYYSGNYMYTASFSNYGSELDITAPGVDIFSTFPYELDTFDGLQDGYTLLDGTSMASPFVAGMAALLRAENPDLSCEEIRKSLLDNAYDIKYYGWDIYSGAGVVNGSTGDTKVPDIFEFPVVYLSGARNNDIPTLIYLIADVYKAKGIPDDSFSGDLKFNIFQYLSNPYEGYYNLINIKDVQMAENEVKTDFSIMSDDDGTVTVPVEAGIGIAAYNFEKSGFYGFSLDSESDDRYLHYNPNTVYRIMNNDAGVSGKIKLQKPADSDLTVYIYAVNEIYSLYIEAGMVPVESFTIRKGETTAEYNLYLPRDTNYKLYYAILDNNDIYYNYGFYKTPEVTSVNPLDYTPVDLTEGSVTGIDLNINIVEDKEDDVSDTRDGAKLFPVDGIKPGEAYSERFLLEYPGDRDFFRLEIKNHGYYILQALPDGNFYTWITVYDSSNNKLASYRRGFMAELFPGTYYVKVENETGIETGSYLFGVGIVPEAIEEPEPVIVEFEDKNLEEAIRNLLGKSVSEAVYEEDVLVINQLDLGKLNISSVKGLEYFKNLWSLELDSNNITDISPLQGLENLVVLDISGNKITDISPIVNLKNLEDLDASNNKISKLPDDLSGLVNLYHLNLANNEITDISPLGTLKSDIESLFLQNNNIADISALSHLYTLKVLYLGGNKALTDYSPVIPYYLSLEDRDFHLPAVENVSISGSNKVGSVLTGSYKYVNPNGHPEKGTTFRWLRSETYDGEYTPIEGAVSTTYKLTGSDADKYIKFEVTPGADGVPSKGVPVTSPAFGPILKASTGGGGSYAVIIDTPSTTPQTPVKEVIESENGSNVLKVDATEIELTWDTAPVIDAVSDENINAAEVKISAKTFGESISHNKPLSIKFNNIVFTFPPGAVNLPEGAEDITLTVTFLTETDLPVGLKPADAKGVSLIFDIQLTVDGKPVTSFEEPVKVTLDLTNVSNPDKTGVYYLNEQNGSWVFMGGKVNENNTITLSTPHFSKFQAMESTKTFSDIQDHWAKEDIEIMAARHVTYGTGDNKFSPDRNITRAEFTALIVRALNIAETTSENPFADVKSGDWFADAVLRASAAEIVKGDGKGYFMPGNVITREEMAAIVVRAYSYYTGKRAEQIITTQEIRFKDMDNASDWARKSITLADALGLMNGMPDKTFRPKNNATRAEAIVVVKRLMKLLEIF